MKKRSAVILAAIVAAFILGCSTVPRTPLQQAEYIYVGISFDYAAAQEIIVAARGQGLIDNNVWATFDQVQHTVAANAPRVRQMLDQWRATGVKPTALDATLALLAGARDAAVQIQKGVKP